MYLRRSNLDRRDLERPRVWRAAIYLVDPVAAAESGRREGLPIDRQRELCRWQARRLGAAVLGEFVDADRHASLRSGLHQALEAAQEERLDYLIVPSLDVLMSNPELAFETGWRLGHAGTVPMTASEAE
jgi:hypothetical protein